MADSVLIERPTEGVGLIRINRPEARNALNMEVRKLIAKHLTEMGEDDAIRCIVLTGNDKSFAAGADIKEMAGAGTIEMLARGTHKLWRTIAACPKPVIAAVNGFALGGGCELAMTCDIIVAGESAKFGQPEVKIGIIPGGGGTQRLPRAVGKYKAMRYVLTGDLFSAKEAFDMGLVSELVPDAEVEKRAVEMAKQIAELSPLAIQQAKEAVLRGMDAALDTGLALETKAIQILFSSQDQKEGMAAFIEKRKPKFSGR
ncbi:MAG: enoyl-CoA hydratase [Betaproteobacteria bacterium RIFCSPLOWO2_12_FULL_62_58]|nr:MAG: enoyl-CoA hydratase [Betaproteobacteria bacterium RIFCSPLOWO2_02_FULL_62_79]OGA47820.1 MAG: enoyl-CoA hydratase [Betaproteobacteria bacterium RIFCSPLOWO2_12_FULL_62_58]